MRVRWELIVRPDIRDYGRADDWLCDTIAKQVEQGFESGVINVPDELFPDGVIDNDIPEEES